MSFHKEYGFMRKVTIEFQTERFVNNEQNKQDISVKLGRTIVKP